MCLILEQEEHGPNNFEYFGKMKKTLKRAGQSVEQYPNTLGHKAEEFILKTMNTLINNIMNWLQRNI